MDNFPDLQKELRPDYFSDPRFYLIPDGRGQTVRHLFVTENGPLTFGVIEAKEKPRTDRGSETRGN